MKKKVLIVTLEQGKNYGGMLQAYALQSTLLKIGLQPVTTWTGGPLLKSAIRKIPFLLLVLHKIKHIPMNQSSGDLTNETQKFIDSNIKTVPFVKAVAGSALGKYGSFVVGSDQVWRKAYTYLPHNLLSFVNRVNVTKISYAASFGRDDLSEYSTDDLRRTKELAKKFRAISVREKGGVQLVNEHWDIAANVHIDPTLLISPDEYKELVKKAHGTKLQVSGSKAFVYVLDQSNDTKVKVEKALDIVRLKPFKLIDDEFNNGNELPSVENWINSFDLAEFIVTDSFHGMVFSIIFNKPFIAIGNSDRGLARFTSLLEAFGLEDRLITSVEDITHDLISKEIDWVSVNAKVRVEQERSLNYLKKYLG